MHNKIILRCTYKSKPYSLEEIASVVADLSANISHFFPRWKNTVFRGSKNGFILINEISKASYLEAILNTWRPEAWDLSHLQELTPQFVPHAFVSLGLYEANDKGEVPLSSEYCSALLHAGGIFDYSSSLFMFTIKSGAHLQEAYSGSTIDFFKYIIKKFKPLELDVVNPDLVDIDSRLNYFSLFSYYTFEKVIPLLKLFACGEDYEGGTLFRFANNLTELFDKNTTKEIIEANNRLLNYINL